MTEFTIPEFLAMLYAVERSREFWRLRRELERRYRVRNRDSRCEAYVDCVLALLWEQGFDQLNLPAGQ